MEHVINDLRNVHFDDSPRFRVMVLDYAQPTPTEATAATARTATESTAAAAATTARTATQLTDLQQPHEDDADRLEDDDCQEDDDGWVVFMRLSSSVCFCSS